MASVSLLLMTWGWEAGGEKGAGALKGRQARGRLHQTVLFDRHIQAPPGSWGCSPSPWQSAAAGRHKGGAHLGGGQEAGAGVDGALGVVELEVGGLRSSRGGGEGRRPREVSTAGR